MYHLLRLIKCDGGGGGGDGGGGNEGISVKCALNLVWNESIRIRSACEQLIVETNASV